MLGRRFESDTWPSYCSFEAYFYFFVFHLIELLLGRVLGSVCEAQLPLCVEEEFTQMQNLVYVVKIGCIRLIVIWLILKLTLYALGVCSFFCLFLKYYFSITD